MTSPVSAAALAEMQALTNATLDQACTIQRASTSSDGAGGFTESFSTVATTTCHMNQPTAGQLQNYDYLIGALSAWQVRLPVGTNVKEADHLVIGSQTLRVQVVLTPRSYPVALVLLATEIQ